MSDYCKHGKRYLSQPTRKCNDCDNEEEIQSLTAERDELAQLNRMVCDNAIKVEADNARLREALGILTALVTQEKGNTDPKYLVPLRNAEKALATGGE